MSRLQPVRGTVDLLPDTMAKHRLVIETARTAALRYGFQEMATPIFEFSEVFSRPLGESSDIVTKENYSFADRGGEMLTLRPENTAGVVRARLLRTLLQRLNQLGKAQVARTVAFVLVSGAERRPLLSLIPAAFEDAYDVFDASGL